MRTPLQLSSRRIQKKITLRALEAKLRQLDPLGRGFSIATLSRWERGEGSPSETELKFWRSGLEALISEAA